MTSTFPLYNQIYEQLPDTLGELEARQKTFFTEHVRQLSDYEHELIFALIRSYQFQHNESAFYILPYNGKRQKKGIKFDLDKLPLELQWILYEFINTHLNVAL